MNTEGPEAAGFQSHVCVWYGLSPTTTFTDSGPTADLEHTPEMVGALLRGKWAKQQLGMPTTNIDAWLADARQSALWCWSGWIRTFPQLPQYRLAPKRKFNWWFGENYDEQWLLTETGTA